MKFLREKTKQKKYEKKNILTFQVEHSRFSWIEHIDYVARP